MTKKRKKTLAFILCVLAALLLGVASLPLVFHVPLSTFFDPDALTRFANGTTGTAELVEEPVVLDSLPDYDPESRLEKRDAPLDELDAASYVLTKIPEEFRNEGLVLARCYVLRHSDGERLYLTLALDCRDTDYGREYSGFSFFKPKPDLDAEIGGACREDMEAIAASIEDGSDYPFEKVSFAMYCDEEFVTGGAGDIFAAQPEMRKRAWK